jgi:nitroreductase
VAPDEENLRRQNLTQAVRNVTDKTSQGAAPVPDAVRITAPETVVIPFGQAGYLVRVAARAPSLHNTQPWRFKIRPDAIELYADYRCQLGTDPIGRELLISCGAALYGLRLAVRSLGRTPEVELFGEPALQPAEKARLRLLARVRLGDPAPVTPAERKMLDAVPHRHTHRGPFEPGPLPAGLLTGLLQDATTEGATLAVIDLDHADRKLAALMATASRDQDLDPVSRAEILRWTRDASSQARDGVPAHAFPAQPDHSSGQLPQRDFDLGRGLGLLTTGGPPAAVTAVLVTTGDGEEDWLRAGQALNRLLLHAASQWVFARLQTQPLQAGAIRGLIGTRLALPGVPQMLLQFGVARTAHATGRRPAADLAEA